MAGSGVLRQVDGGALAMLCEDISMLDTLRRGLLAQARDIAKKAAASKTTISGNALTVISRTVEGQRCLKVIRALTSQIIIQRREFGLTPSSSAGVEASGPGIQLDDPLERMLCLDPKDLKKKE
jgi:Phage terminase, small subunit